MSKQRPDLHRNGLERVIDLARKIEKHAILDFARSEPLLGGPNQPVPTRSNPFLEPVRTGSIPFPSPMGERVDREAEVKIINKRSWEPVEPALARQENAA